MSEKVRRPKMITKHFLVYGLEETPLTLTSAVSNSSINAAKDVAFIDPFTTLVPMTPRVSDIAMRSVSFPVLAGCFLLNIHREKPYLGVSST